VVLVPSGFLVVFEKPNRSSLTFTFTACTWRHVEYECFCVPWSSPYFSMGPLWVQVASLLHQQWITDFHWLPLQRDPVLNVVSRKVRGDDGCRGRQQELAERRLVVGNRHAALGWQGKGLRFAKCTTRHPSHPHPPRPIQVFPGSVLLRIGMGPSGPTVPPLTWESEVEAALRDRQPYKLRVHVYQVCGPVPYVLFRGTVRYPGQRRCR
jgi:hypothetical protein